MRSCFTGLQQWAEGGYTTVPLEVKQFGELQIQACHLCKPHKVPMTLQFQGLRLKTVWTLQHPAPSAPPAITLDPSPQSPEQIQQQALQQTFTGPAVQMPRAVPNPDALEPVQMPPAVPSPDALEAVVQMPPAQPSPDALDMHVLSPEATSSADAFYTPNQKKCADMDS